MKFLSLLLGAAFAWGQQPTPPADPVVLTVGEEKITKSQFEQIISSLPEQSRTQFQTPAGKKRLAEQLAELKTLAQQARAQKLDQAPKVKAEIALQTEQVLARNEFAELANAVKPDDAALHAYYDAHKQDWEQVKARHILIRFQGSQVPAKTGAKDLTDAEALAKANDIRAKVLAGGDFAKLAETESDDVGTAPRGGDLGAFGKGRMVPAFEKAAFAAEIGKITEPVKSQFGYHLIIVQEHSTKGFDEVKTEIEQKSKPDMAQKALAELKTKTTIVYDETYFGK
ncbi:MAG TPA: peptidylprolyl isomerase [Bryobacteraceae bacterium]|jgi:peptidyl-prolyl cis-trans isomerase C|nr:peptidylprolyl isomerase [Bryobacteraceae bacterium]